MLWYPLPEHATVEQLWQVMVEHEPRGAPGECDPMCGCCSDRFQVFRAWPCASVCDAGQRLCGKKKS